VNFSFVGDGGIQGSALEAGVEHKGERAEVFVGEGDEEVVAGVVEGEDDGLEWGVGLCGERGGEKQREKDDEEALPGLHGLMVAGRAICGWQTLPMELGF
jgi:hypothetical protein